MELLRKGDTVLVTGASGYIGNHVVDQLVAAGYFVRGAVRDHAKAQFLIDYINKKHGSDKLEIVDVPDMVQEDAFDVAVKGVSGIVHVAAVLSMSAVPEEVIQPSVKGTLNIFRSALREPKVKSLVVTSSSTAAITPIPNKRFVVTQDTWNEAALEEVLTNSSPTPLSIYMASKVESERALWNAVQEKPPSFQVATILPNMNFGTRIREAGNSSNDFLTAAYRNEESLLTMLPPQWYINVVDDAKLHVSALVDPACNGERIFGFAGTYTWNKIRSILQKIEPSGLLAEEKDMGMDLSEVPNASAEALLRKHYGHGFATLEESVRQGLAPIDT